MQLEQSDPSALRNAEIKPGKIARTLPLLSLSCNGRMAETMAKEVELAALQAFVRSKIGEKLRLTELAGEPRELRNENCRRDLPL